MRTLRNGAVSVKFQVAMCLRWLARGSAYDLMDGRIIGKSTAHAIVCRTVDAIIAQDDLGGVWPDVSEAEANAAAFKHRSTNNVITRCVGCIDGLFIRIRKPRTKEHAQPNLLYSGHKRAMTMNFEVSEVG